MKAVWSDGKRVTLHQVPVPQPRRGWALVEVVQAGICGTDLALAEGLYGFQGIPGHEFVGRVVQGSKHWAGQRVVADINVACGRCRHCRQHDEKHCGFRRVLGIRDLNGCFAEYVQVPLRNLRVVPSNLDDDAAVFAEPLAAALAARDSLERAGGSVLVVGPGRLGQLVVRVLGKEGLRVSCLGRGHDSLSRLPPGVEREDSLPDAWAGRFEAVVECSGSAGGVRSALRAARPRGTVVLKGTCRDEVSVDLSRAVVDEIRLQGSRCGNMSSALTWLAAGHIEPRGLITARVPLQDAQAAFHQAADPAHMKVILQP